MKIDINGGWHGPDGRWATAKEVAAYLAGKSAGVVAGLAAGTARGVAIGVSMSARAVGWSVQRLWCAIRRSRSGVSA